MLNNKRTVELAVHFNATDHSLSDIDFIVMERLRQYNDTTHLRVIVRENQADDERWGSADSDHIFAVRYPYPTDNQGNILFSIALIGFEYDHPP